MIIIIESVSKWYFCKKCLKNVSIARFRWIFFQTKNIHDHLRRINQSIVNPMNLVLFKENLEFGYKFFIMSTEPCSHADFYGI